jgi:hypothetical protein
MIIKKYECGGRLNVNIYILLYGETYESFYLDKWSLVQGKIVKNLQALFKTLFFYEGAKCGDGVKFWGVLGQTLNRYE